MNSPTQIISVRTLRVSFGVLGIAFPIALVLCGGPVLKSISAYHWHPQMGMFYSGVLWAIGVFLFSYHGPKFFGYEDWSGNIAAVGALTTAIFYPRLPDPTSDCWPDYRYCLPEDCSSPNVVLFNGLHLAGTILLLVSFLLFTARYAAYAKRDGYRVQYTILFWICLAVTCVGGVVAIVGAVVRRINDSYFLIYTSVLWGEAAVIWGFSIAWLVRAMKEPPPRLSSSQGGDVAAARDS